MIRRISITLMIFLSFLFVPIRAQERIVISNDSTGTQDTLVLITPGQVQIINGVFTELDYTKQEVALRDSLILNDSLMIAMKNEIIREQWYYIQRTELLMKKKKRKSVALGTTLGTVLGVAGGIVLGVLISK